MLRQCLGPQFNELECDIPIPHRKVKSLSFWSLLGSRFKGADCDIPYLGPNLREFLV